MTETPTSAQPPSNFQSVRGRLGSLIVQGSLLLGECIAIGWMIERIMSGDWVQAACLGQFLLAMAAASIAPHSAGTRRRQVYEPLRRLEIMLPEIRAGRTPIEAISEVGDQVAPIVRQTQDLLREIRAQKAMLADMDRQVRQRIANRTEALERKIGSLRHQATRDALTGLLNRRAMDEHLTKIIEASSVTAIPVSVLMIDVDNFKLLNDTLGHAAGDELLRSIGQILRSTLREGDTAFRCGGDEFVLVLHNCDVSGARSLAERLGSTVDGLTRTMKVPAPPRLSIGAACINEVAPRSAAGLMQEADKRLYAVKGGRQRELRNSPASISPKPSARKSA